MKTIYADFNDMSADNTLPLTCAGSRASLAKVSAEPGEQVLLTDGALLVMATVHLLPNGSWEARSDWRFEEHEPR